MREAIAKSRRAPARAASQQEPPRSPAAGASDGAAASAPQTPQRPLGAARRLGSREHALAQMNDVAEAADTGAWLHEMIYRYHAEHAPPSLLDV